MMTEEIWQDLIFGLAAFTIPFACWVGTLNVKLWWQGRHRLPLARALAIYGWTLQISAIAVSAITDQPPIEHGPMLVRVIFTVGLILTCLGFLGVARQYHVEARPVRKDRAEDGSQGSSEADSGVYP